MAGMGFMIAAASRPRDERGRYAEGDEGRRMGNDHSTHMGGYDRMETTEMRRRRDSRGRYMDHDDGSRMAYDGNESAYRPWPEPHIPPYLDSHGMEDGSRMRDHNIVNIRDYQDKRRIGFGENLDEGGEDMRLYGRRYKPDRMSMGRSTPQPHMMGYADGEDDGEHLTRDEAEKWVKGMKSEDGKTGGRWPYQEIKQYAGNFGVNGDEVVEFFAVMNALYTDYCKVAKKYGVDKVDFWADLAKAFMRDKDSGEGKVKKYYECIAKHDDD